MCLVLYGRKIAHMTLLKRSRYSWASYQAGHATCKPWSSLIRHPEHSFWSWQVHINIPGWTQFSPVRNKKQHFFHLLWLHIWHWSALSPKTHHFCDFSEVKKDRQRSWSAQLSCLLGQHTGVTLILAHARYQEKEASY